MVALILTILGLAVPLCTSLISTISSDKKKNLKTWLIILGSAGFLMGVISSSIAYNDKLDAEDKKLEAETARKYAEQRLDDMKKMLEFVTLTTGNLGKLKELTGGAEYYVTIATDRRKKNLEPYLKNLETMFSGAKSSGLIAINPKVNPHNIRDTTYELVFGQHLDVTAAEVFQRLAMSHHLTPSHKRDSNDNIVTDVARIEKH